MSTSPKIILVTGGTGFIGAYLLRHLISTGCRQVRALRRSNSPMALVRRIANQIEWHEGDVLNPDSLLEAMKGAHQVYHSAAVVSFQGRDTLRMTSVNVEGTANVVNMAMHSGIEKLVHVSSIAALPRTNAEAIDEKARWTRGSHGSHYGLTKHLAEMEVWRGMAEGLPAAIVNPANVLGSGFWKGRTSTGQLFYKIWKGLKLYPLGASGFVDVRDVVRFMVQLMESDITGERFILSAENLAFRQLFEQIAGVLQVPPPNIAANFFLRETAWRAAWVVSKLNGQAPLITKETVRSSANKYRYNNGKSLNTFTGFSYTPISGTVADTGRQFLECVAKGFPPAILPMLRENCP